MVREYDLIIFGATGFAGKYCVEDVVKMQQAENSNLYTKFKWAIAGRSMAKMEQVLRDVTDFTGVDVTEVGKIEADLTDMDSLRQMAAQTSVLVNCVGPYLLYGEEVVLACILERTDYVDICGEQQFLDQIQIDFHREAELMGLYIVGSCGIECIPADCGVEYLRKVFDGDINTVDSFMELDPHDQPLRFHYGTFHSVIQFLNNMDEIRQLQGTLLSRRLPKSKYKTSKLFPVHYSKETNSIVSLFYGPDSSVVKRTQYYLYTEENRRPIQYNPYLKFPGAFKTFFIAIAALIIFLLSLFKLGRFLLRTFPSIFTLGVVSKKGPTRTQAETVDFKITMIANGWKEKLKPLEFHDDPPNKTLRLIIKGKNPAYSATATMAIEAALTIAFERSSLPSTGGVYTPAVAFDKTTLFDRIKHKGILIEIVGDQEP